MTRHKTGTRQEWLIARLELLEAEKELATQQRARTPASALPWVRIDKEYRFETDEGGGGTSLVDPQAGPRHGCRFSTESEPIGNHVKLATPTFDPGVKLSHEQRRPMSSDWKRILCVTTPRYTCVPNCTRGATTAS
jgi:hypothetical protein